MSAPTASVRAQMLERDEYRCYACGARRSLEAQHRNAVGSGGSKIRPEVCAVITACTICNQEFEREMQVLAYLLGWKIRGDRHDPTKIPVFDEQSRSWFRLVFDGDRNRIGPVAAVWLLRDVYGDLWDGWLVKAKVRWPERVRWAFLLDAGALSGVDDRSTT